MDNFNNQQNNKSIKNKGPFIFGIIWIISCLSILFSIMGMKIGSYGYIFYMIIGFFLLIGVVTIIKSVKDKDNISNSDNNYEYTDDEIRSELQNSNPVINKVEIGTLYVSGIRSIVASFLASLFVIFNLLMLIGSLSSGKKLSDILLDLAFFLMAIVVYILCAKDGRKKLKLAKKIRNVSKDI